jgi:2'-5' RNA ligase
VAMEVDRVAVFQSRLGRGGASYRVVEEHRLDG